MALFVSHMDLLWIKTNSIIKSIFSNYVWSIPNHEKKVFLTFDDGPIPEITDWVLIQLKKYSLMIPKNYSTQIVVYFKLSS